MSDDISIQALRGAFDGRLIADAVEMGPFLTDWRGHYRGQALAVVQPDTAADVAKVVAWCAEHRVAITPQGGNTGLAGGSVPAPDGRNIVLSLARLNRVRAVDPANGTITVEAGVPLAAVQAVAAAAGRLFPLSLASEGSCTIGGNLATNAGGVAVLRYGNARELCLGLEVVTPQGALWDGLRGLRKNNTGYDLRDLYVGSEGTLGVITAAVMKFYPLPAARLVALAAVPTPQAAVALLQLAQARLDAGLTAFELISQPCLDLVLKHRAGARAPYAGASPWHVLIELSAPLDEAQGRAALEGLLQAALDKGLAVDAVVSASLAQADALWTLREGISEAQSAEGASIKHDIAVPISRIADFIEAGQRALLAISPSARPMTFGHLGDGNLHFNVSAPAGADKAAFMALQPAMNLAIHDLVAAYDGSISAEHGLGLLRRDEAIRYRSPLETQLMRTLKTALDPENLMNPGKVLP